MILHLMLLLHLLVDGFLVGGACLAADSFGVILSTFD